MGRTPYEVSWKEKMCQMDRFAKKMPRDHGPEETSEVEELDLAL